ncbi:hypothetical protein IAR50_003953 [Cryptococcus sp. DSM 104548]
MTWWKKSDDFWAVWNQIQHSFDETSDEERDFEHQVNQEVAQRQREREQHRAQERNSSVTRPIESSANEVASSSTARQNHPQSPSAVAEDSPSGGQPIIQPEPPVSESTALAGSSSGAAPTSTCSAEQVAVPIPDKSTSPRVGGWDIPTEKSMLPEDAGVNSVAPTKDSGKGSAQPAHPPPSRAEPSTQPLATLSSFHRSRILRTSTPQALRISDTTAQEIPTPENTPQTSTAPPPPANETPVKRAPAPSRRMQPIETPEQVSSPIDTPTHDPTPGRPGTVGKRNRLNAETPAPRGKQRSVSSRSLQQTDPGAAKGQGRRGRGKQATENPKTSDIFKELVFFYAGVPNRQYQMRCGLIHDNGGSLVSQNNDTITHVIFDGKTSTKLLEFLKVKSLDELPEGTEVVKWDWLSLCLEREKVQPIDSYLHRSLPQSRHSSASSRGLAARATSRMADITDTIRARVRSDTESESEESLPKKRTRTLGYAKHIRHAEQVANGTFGPPRSRPAEPSSRGVHDVNTVHDLGSGVGAGWKKGKQGGRDGLDEIIEGVKEGSLSDAEGFEGERAAHPASDDRSDTDEDNGNPNPLADRFMFGRKNDGVGKAGPNEFLAKKFEALYELYEGQPGKNTFSIRMYRQAAATMRRTTVPITSGTQAKTIKGIGDSLAERIDEFLTGTTGRADYEDNEQARCTKLFKDVYGIGRQMAYNLYQQGARSIADLRSGAYPLSPGQKIGLDLYDDLNTRIPRAECKRLYDLIREEALGVDEKLWVEIMGSYRRGQESSGDVDILITRDDGDGVTHAGVLRRLVGGLKKKGVITHDLSEPGDWDAVESKWMGVGRVGPEGKFRRIDILCIPFESWGASLIYFTGNELFNRSLRLYARKLGFSLNQRGLYKGVVRGRDGLKTVAGDSIASRTEEEIFDILGVRWRHPHHRNP